MQKPKENNRTLRFHLIIIRWPKLTKQWRRMMDEMCRKWKLSSSLPGFQTVQPSLKLVWMILKNQTINLSYDHATVICGVGKDILLESYFSSMFIGALFAITKKLKHPKCTSTDEWKCMVYLHYDIVFCCKEKWNYQCYI